MGALVHLFASGGAFFVGLALVLLSLGLGLCSRGRAVEPAAAWSGILFVALSAAPAPWLSYAAFVLAVAWWRLPRQRTRGAALAGVLVSVFVLAAFESPWHRMPRVPLGPGAPLVVVGDSISAGLGGSDAGTWPARLAVTRGIPVVNLARAGATTASALEQARQIPPGPATVVVEIGGNDLLAGTPVGAFRASLAALLRSIESPDRRILMLELPLLPMQNRYGLAQRELARAHHVSLLPRRLLAGAITGRGHTLDGLHLSPLGHEWLSAELWPVLEPN